MSGNVDVCCTMSADCIRRCLLFLLTVSHSIVARWHPVLIQKSYGLDIMLFTWYGSCNNELLEMDLLIIATSLDY